MCTETLKGFFYTQGPQVILYRLLIVVMSLIPADKPKFQASGVTPGTGLEVNQHRRY